MKKFNCKPNAHIFCTLINGLGSEGRLDEALKYFHLSKNEGFVEIPIYNALIGAYCRVLRFEDAFNVLKKMNQNGSGPNTRTYDIILNHLIKDNQLNQAFKIFREMSEKTGSEPQINTYTMIISMFCANKRLDMALKVWEEMNKKGVAPCMHMFCSVINGLCSENRSEEACEYFEEMLEKGIRPPSRLFGNLKAVLIRTGKKELAFEIGCKLERLRRTPLNEKKNPIYCLHPLLKSCYMSFKLNITFFVYATIL
ncbi:hypothetical protein LUZ60_001992 [Juncus effusus]|nr:hypothetical protein LUZ60_001992 [Juncus effusus]